MFHLRFAWRAQGFRDVVEYVAGACRRMVSWRVAKALAGVLDLTGSAEMFFRQNAHFCIWEVRISRRSSCGKGATSRSKCVDLHAFRVAGAGFRGTEQVSGCHSWRNYQTGTQTGGLELVGKIAQQTPRWIEIDKRPESRQRGRQTGG